MLSTALMLSLLLLDHVRRANGDGSNDTSTDDPGAGGHGNNGNNVSDESGSTNKTHDTTGRLEH